MSILSSLKKASQNLRNTVFNSISNAVSKVTGTSQTGAVLNATGVTSKSITPKATVSQPRYTVPGSNATYTKAGLANIGLTPTSPNVGGGAVAYEVSNTTPAKNESDYNIIGVPTKTTTKKTTVSKSSTPTNLSNINSGVGEVNLSRTSTGISGDSNLQVGNIMGGIGTAQAMGSLAELNTKNEQEIKTAKELEAEEAKLYLEKGIKEEQSWLKDMFKERENQPTIAEQRADLERQYGIQAKVSEINSLQDSLNKVQTEAQNQVTATRDVLGSMNFINNQIAQIERNSAPAINLLKADINFKTGILTQNQQLVEQAIQDATAEYKQRWEDKKFFYNEYYDDVISKLSSDYDTALKLSIQEDENEYDYQVKLAEWKRDVIIEYGLSNSINDSEAVIMKSLERAGYQTVSDKSSGNLTKTQQKTYEAYRSQISTYKSKEEAISELDKVKFGVIKAIGQTGYDLLVNDISSSQLPDKSESFWSKLMGWINPSD